jgi:hypothetical protein
MVSYHVEALEGVSAASIYLFQFIVAHPLLTPRRCSDRGLALFAAASRALHLLLGRCRLSSCGALGSQHLVSQVVSQLPVFGRQLAKPILGNPVVPTARCQHLNGTATDARAELIGLRRCDIDVNVEQCWSGWATRKKCRRGANVTSAKYKSSPASYRQT